MAPMVLALAAMELVVTKSCKSGKSSLKISSYSFFDRINGINRILINHVAISQLPARFAIDIIL
jgi:hypothetical protein